MIASGRGGHPERKKSTGNKEDRLVSGEHTPPKAAQLPIAITYFGLLIRSYIFLISAPSTSFQICLDHQDVGEFRLIHDFDAEPFDVIAARKCREPLVIAAAGGDRINPKGLGTNSAKPILGGQKLNRFHHRLSKSDKDSEGGNIPAFSAIATPTPKKEDGDEDD